MSISRILSLQSHVVSGYVGNKSAVFPLQVLGFDVDSINSVQFSNHTGYKIVKGQVLNSRDLNDLIEGLALNGLNNYSHLLTGYIGSKSSLEALKALVKNLKGVNPHLTYICDPVMGDNGKMYVPEELLQVYKNEIIPLADIVTPNQFEAESLSGIKIITLNNVVEVMDWFHSIGVKTVVLSSTELGSEKELISTASSIANGKKEQLMLRMPRFPCNFTGSGDLFAALLLAWMHLTNNDVKSSLEKTIATLQAVLRKTLSYALSISGEETWNPKDMDSRGGTWDPKDMDWVGGTWDPKDMDSIGSTWDPKDTELKLVQSLDEIRNPKVSIFASEIILG